MAQTQGVITQQANRATRRCNRLCLPKRYRPTVEQWKVLYALKPGLLPMSSITIAGAHVSRASALALAEAGLAMVDERGMVGLTDRGLDRVTTGW